jgi:hypothetical protein
MNAEFKMPSLAYSSQIHSKILNSAFSILNSPILVGEAALEFGDRGCRSVMKNLGDRGWCLR